MTIQLILLPRVACRGQEITAPRIRGLLALLAGELRSGRGTAQLVSELWPDKQPDNPAKALQILVSRVRSQLGSDIIATTPTGYRLALGEDEVDSSAVLLSAAASARHARAGDHATALTQAEAGLALWEGTPGGRPSGDTDDTADPLSGLRAERADTYGSLVRARALALARLGRSSDAVDLLADLFRQRPRDEEILLELLRCESTTVGAPAALARYETYRRSLRDELGTDPGAALQAMHRQLLRDAEPTVRRGVSHEPNPLLGRDKDIAAVTSMLRASRVTSIVGPGGLGKTRLAHVVSRDAEQHTVYFVPLAGVDTDDDVANEVASALGVGESRGPAMVRAVAPDVFTGIVSALGAGPTLLVLDNCEHVIAGAADLVYALVSATKDLSVLTTSRAPLDLSSESVYLLPELDLPTSIELFEQRATAARPGAELPTDTVDELCRHLDGLPLAVELAAARTRVMSVSEIARRLDDRFALLRGGPRDTPERHHTLRAVVDWSWNLLEPAGQTAMRALSIFPGGFTADAAQRLLDLPGRGDGDVMPVLEDLVEQSLLKVEDTPAGVRFRMLETVREFSAEHRESMGETDLVVDGLLAWARDFGVAHHDAVFGPDPRAGTALIRAEQDNLLLALRYALTRSDDATVAASSAVLAGLWLIESNFSRLATLADETAWVLSHARPEPAMIEVTRTASVLCTLIAFMLQGPRVARFLVTVRRLPPPARPVTLIGALWTVMSAVPEVLCSDNAVLRDLCDSDEPLVGGAANGLAAYLWERENDVDSALKAARRMLDVFDSPQTPWIRVMALGRVGELCMQTEQGAEARRYFEMALAGQEGFGDADDRVGIRGALAQANLHVGDVEEAQRWLELAAQGQTYDDVAKHSYGVGVQAEIAMVRGEIEEGLRLWRQAAGLLRDAESPVVGGDPRMDPWYLEVHAVVVVAHARHGRLDVIEEIVAELPGGLMTLLSEPDVNRPAYVMEPGVCGALLLALAMVELDRGRRGADERATRAAAELVALAERFRFLRNFQPTMSSARAREAAVNADRPAYEAASSSYAGLDREQLRSTALTVLRERELI